MDGTGENAVTASGRDPAQCGLHRYVQLVAAALGADLNGSRYGWSSEATAYLPLPQRMPGNDDHRLALVWDEKSGWSVGVEIDDDFLVLASYSEDIVPAPRVVAAFVHNVVVDGHVPAVLSGDYRRSEVLLRLAAYAPTGPDAQTAMLPPHSH
ncbi:DUF6292 family protein [Lentzea alba]|uniref:DUF6292 family protein n=1 Tax=Lentzea alba TaxID=2714351 RepID=UPI0039BF3623